MNVRGQDLRNPKRFVAMVRRGEGNLRRCVVKVNSNDSIFDAMFALSSKYQVSFRDIVIIKEMSDDEKRWRDVIFSLTGKEAEA